MKLARKVHVSDLLDRDARVRVERSFGLATGHDRELQALRRFLEYHLMRFLITRKITGRWSVLAYVSREEVK